MSETGFVLCLGAMSFLSPFIGSRNAEAAAGDIAATYNFAAASFTMHPTLPYMYATIPSQNSIAIINTNTLAVENTIFVGSGPVNIAFSPNGQTAYIANSTSNFLAVFDTQTRTVTNSFLLPQQPRDVVVGNGNRLFVLGTDSIMQINATTGASAGVNVGAYYIVYSGALEISPDRNSLYYGDYGLSPAKMYKFDVTTTTPVELWESPHGPHGSNGQDLTLSHDGTFISFATGSGQNNYQIAKFRTSDMAMLGSFNTGAYPQEIAFSPDDLMAYAVHTSGRIDVFNTTTFLSAGSFTATNEATELEVASNGRYLFASYSDPYGQGGFVGTRVFDTGRTVVPEPTAGLLLAAGVAMVGLRRRRG
jgi:YVTN family beta-propeller protein